MIRTKLAVVISSVLLASVATQAQPAPADDAAAPTSPNQSSVPTESTPAQGADTATQGNGDVGSSQSNVDEHATSGSYYPFSAGTVGDDPAAPGDTQASGNTGDPAGGATNQWKNADTDDDGYLSPDELRKVAPALADNFADIDVDANRQLTRDEFRAWHMSQKARMDADQGAPAASAPATDAPAGTVPATEPPAGTVPATEVPAGTEPVDDASKE
jgi:hypothetical protein